MMRLLWYSSLVAIHIILNRRCFTMKMRRIAAFIAALTMAGTFASCADNSTGGSTTTTEATTTTAATTPKVLDEEDKELVQEIDTGDDEKLENGTVRWLASWDLNPANGKPKMVEVELFETKYGGTIEYIPTTYETRYSDLSTMVLGGSAPDLFSAADFDTFPGDAISGMFQPFDDYLDFNGDFWNEGGRMLSDKHTINGKHYVAVTSTDAGCVCIYNKKVIEENGLTDPAELLAEDNWTWDTFRDMCAEFSSRENEQYGFDGWWFEINLLLTTGTPVITMDNGKIVSNITSPEIERAENFMYEMKKDDIPFPHAEYDWKEQPARVAEGKTLFYPCGIWALYETDLSKFGEPEDIMFVPMPKDPKADEYYLPSGIDAFALCKSAPNPEAAGVLMKCKLLAVGDERGKEIAEKQYREDYGWNDDMIDMWYKTKELTNAHPVIDFYAGVSQNVYDMVHNPIKDASYNCKEWNITRDEISEAVQAEIDELNVQIEENFN